MKLFFKKDEDTMRQVFVNNVLAGEIADEDYSAIRDEELRSGRNHLAQAGNILVVCGSAMGALLRSLPLAVFYGLIALFVWEPEGFRQIAAAFQTDPAGFLRRSAELLTPLFIISIAFTTAISGANAFGFKNMFDIAINFRVRRKLGTPATGNITVLCLNPFLFSQQESRQHVLGLPVPLFLGYSTPAVMIMFVHPGNLVATAIGVPVAHGVLHYLYRNGKLDRFLSLADKWRQRWEQRRQEKRKA